MSRIRTIKPELFSSASAKRLPMGARWLFAGLLTEADDDGRLLASARKIAGNVFPNDDDVTEAHVEGWLCSLEAKGMIAFYVVGGVRYLHIPNFRKHQRVSHPTPSRLPAPPETSGATPEVLASPSGKAPEPLGKDLGSGIEVEREVEVEAAAPPPSLTPQETKPRDPSRQNRNVPVRAGTVVARIGIGGKGFMENPDDWPKTPAAFLEKHGAELRKRFPAYDGKQGRSPLLEVVTSKWESYTRKRDGEGGFGGRGPEEAFSALCAWIAKDYVSVARAWQQQGNVDTSDDDPVRRRAREAWWRRYQKGEDVGAFDPWFEKNRADFEKKPAPTTTEPHPADLVSPEEVRELLASARPKTGPPKRAPTSGGEAGSGREAS